MRTISKVRALFTGLAIIVVATAAGSALAADPSVAEGKRIWNVKENKCVSCHGADGKADTKLGKAKKIPDMTTSEWQKSFTDQQILDSVLKGIDRMDGERKVKMQPLKGATEADAKSVLLFVRSLGPTK